MFVSTPVSKLSILTSVMAAGVLQVPFLQKTIGGLSSVLRGDETLEIKEEAICSHLKLIEDDSRFVIDPEFPSNLSWFNTNGVPLSFSSGQLEGNLILLDFFTYCCINCLHLLPDLARLEEKYGLKEGLLVVGVHSAKFLNEKGEANILNAILRYDIHHPVLNDANIQLWERLGISCWPTLVLIGPGNKLLYYIIGEGHYLELETMVGTALRYYKSRGILRGVSVGVVLEKEKKVESILNFPGKVVAFERGVAVGGAKELFLAVSDSSNHRVLLVDATTGLVKQVYGSGSAGCKDGRGEGAEFNSPQGIVFCSESLYVADTENHLIRKVILKYCAENFKFSFFRFHSLTILLSQLQELVTKATIKREVKLEQSKKLVLHGILPSVQVQNTLSGCGHY